MSTGPLEVRFSPLTQIVRHRLLTIPGEVLVRVGDRVQAHDVVAQAPVEGPLYVINVAEALGVSVSQMSRYLQVTEGQLVTAGAVLAKRRRWWMRERQVTALHAGKVQGITEGCVFLRREPEMLQLRAYLPGEIMEEYPHRGVAIQSAGALVRGIWGSGPERQGPILTVGDGPGDPLTLERVSLRYRGSLLVAGTLSDARVLVRAQRFRVSGLILGSIAPGLRAACEQIGLPVVVTEGMGCIPMAEPIYELLRASQGQLAIISGANRDGQAGPEVVVPLEAEHETLALTVVRPLEVGVRVRLTRPPFVGLIGQVTALPGVPQETSIGTLADGAEVRLGDGHIVFVPFVNMELLA